MPCKKKKKKSVFNWSRKAGKGSHLKDAQGGNAAVLSDLDAEHWQDAAEIQRATKPLHQGTGKPNSGLCRAKAATIKGKKAAATSCKR